MGMLDNIMGKLGFNDGETKTAAAGQAAARSQHQASAGRADPASAKPAAATRAKTGDSAQAKSGATTQAKPAAGTQAKSGAATQAKPAAATQAPQATAPRAPAEMPQVDVMGKLQSLAAANPQKLNWQESIVDLLKLLDIDSSLAARRELAAELGCPAEKMGDSAQMNVWLHRIVLEKLAENGGNIPRELLN